MKRIIFLVLTTGLFLSLNSCVEKDCKGVGADDIVNIDFYNFVQTDLDTIVILSYAKNTNFTTHIDSAVTQAIQRYGSNYFSASAGGVGRIKTELDYKIKITSTGEVFTIMGFETEKTDCASCKACLMGKQSDNYYNKLDSYLINGQRQQGETIKIYK